MLLMLLLMLPLLLLVRLPSGQVPEMLLLRQMAVAADLVDLKAREVLQEAKQEADFTEFC